MCVSPPTAAAGVPSWECDEGWRPLATLQQSQSVDDDDDEHGGVEEDQHDDDVPLATITAGWVELEANIVFSSFANSVFQSFANIVFSSFVIKRIKRFAADIKFLSSCFLLCWPTLNCANKRSLKIKLPWFCWQDWWNTKWNKLASLVDAIAISNLKLWIFDWLTDW